jgi:hypothetical protein
MREGERTLRLQTALYQCDFKVSKSQTGNSV